MRKRLNLGNSDFKSMILDDNYYVDKSLFIKEIIDSEHSVLLIPRPRRFGKTLNLSMLRYYFDITEPENEKLFTHLKIWQCDNEIKAKRGKYPVIFLSFKDAKGQNWDETYNSIVLQISKLYSQNDYLLKSKTLSDSEKEFFESILSKKGSKTDFSHSIKELSDFLYKYFQQKVVILLDEYDTPIHAGYKKYYEEIVSFMRTLMSGAFKDNIYLQKGVITGILRVSKESIFSGLNNIGVFSILDDSFSDCFGFTEFEVKQIVADFEVATDENEIKKWYNGYQFGNTSGIFNPWSILNFAYKSRSGFRTFWVNTSADNLIKDIVSSSKSNELLDIIEKLINFETVEKDIEENFIFPKLETHKELIWTLLIHSGYLTTVNKIARKTYEIKIPNYEILTVFQDTIVDWFDSDINVHRDLLSSTAKYLVTNEIEKFEKGFRKIIGDTFSYYDTNGTPEKVYQAYLLGLLAIIGDDYIIKSNRESGDGRYDIMLIPHDKTKNGIVMELKQIEKRDSETEMDLNERIQAKLKDALNQIDKNEYYKELIDNKIERIIKLPIVFAGKVPYVVIKS